MSSRVPWICVARLCATSVNARIIAISGFRCVPTPKLNSAGSLKTSSSLEAVTVHTPTSLVISINFTLIDCALNLSSKSLITSFSILSLSICLLFLWTSSNMLHASRSITSKIPCNTASSRTLPDARPLVFPLNSGVALLFAGIYGWNIPFAGT